MLNRLLVADTIARIRSFAVAIRKFPTHTHAGVIYISPTEGKPFLLHLGGPGRLTREDWTPAWGWAVPATLKVEELRQFAVLCQHMAELQEDIPYGFKYHASVRFTRDGRLDKPDGYKGLTCATFILALLATYDVLILDLETWPERQEDQDWIEWLSDYHKDPGIKAELPCLRYRPEEVVAGCLSGTAPVAFDVAEPMGREVVTKMEEFGNRRRSGI